MRYPRFLGFLFALSFLLPGSVHAVSPQTILVDGTNDFLAENLIDPDGYDAEFSEIDIDSVFVTNDENNLYIGLQYDEGGWSDCCIGIAIDLGDAFGGLTDPWARQIEWSEAPNPPNFISYVEFDGNWQELRSWSGSSWGLVCAGMGGCGQATGTGFKEFQFSLSTIGVTSEDTLYLEMWTNQGSSKGALDLVASDSRQESTPGGTTWDPATPTKPNQYVAFVVMDVPDIVPPVLDGVFKPVASKLRLVFSEAVDPVTAEIAGNYTVDGAGVDSARVDGVDPSLVDLYLDSDLIADGLYRSVTVTAIEDEAGNPIVENGIDNVAFFFLKGVLFRGDMAEYMRGWFPGSSLWFSVEGTPGPLTWTLCDNLMGDADGDTLFSAYAEFGLSAAGPSGPAADETIYFKFVHNCTSYEPLPENRNHILSSATGARDTLDLEWYDPSSRKRGPYLSWRNDPATTMTVNWQTKTDGTSLVEYGPDAGYGFSVSDAGLTEWHVVELTGFSPRETIHYRASSSSGFESEDHVFMTGPSVGESFQFLAYGDSRTDSVAHQAVVDRMETEDPFVILHTGDLVGDGESLSDWDAFFHITEDLISNVPFMPAIGNHEDNAPLYFNLFAVPNDVPPSNGQWYSFDVGCAHYVALSTDTNYSAGSVQYNWLVSDLAAASGTAQWIFVYFHHPPFSSGSHGSDLNVRSTLCPVFEAYGVTAVFNGHDHLYERSVYHDIAYIIAGGGGAPLSDPNQNPNPYQVYADDIYHYCRVTVEPYHCLIEAIDTSGAVFDSVSFHLTDVAEDGGIRTPDRTAIVGVYPNPSASGVEIRYSLARDVTPRIAVYDVRGREVRSLEPASPSAGIQAVGWDRTDRLGHPVPPGVYFIRLTVGQTTDVRKVVLVE